VAIIGCGGLGGYIIEELARIGVGRIIVMDPDSYEEHNLNRQLQSDITVLGRAKVRVIQERVAQINPVVEVIPIVKRFTGKLNSPLDKAQVIIDGLDSVADRKLLAGACDNLKRPLVHGAVEGWYGQVAVILPGTDSFSRLYPRQGSKTTPGVLSFTVATVAGLQASETCKLLLNIDSPLQSHLLTIDLRNCDSKIISL
jgi:molybdopterin/thiamine biosynthesis adenylyltransferase